MLKSKPLSRTCNGPEQIWPKTGQKRSSKVSKGSYTLFEYRNEVCKLRKRCQNVFQINQKLIRREKKPRNVGLIQDRCHQLLLRPWLYIHIYTFGYKCEAQTLCLKGRLL